MRRRLRPGDALLGLLASGGAALVLGWLHQIPRLPAALACGAVAGVFVIGLRPAWRHLPGFVGGWIAAGIASVVVLVAALATVLAQGIPYVVLRLSEVVAVGSTAALLGVATSGLAYTHHRLAAEVAAQSARLAEARQRALEGQLAALTAQIRPHFLFNALNTLAEVVHEDPDLAEGLIEDLARMMRYTLRSSAEPDRWVALQEELEIVRRLLRVEEARLGERLRWTVDATPEALSVRLPGLLVQPLVENAVQHGVAHRPEGGRVAVRAACRAGRLEVVVEDDGPGLPLQVVERREAGHGGLSNVAARARLAWSSGTLRIDEVDRGARLVLDVPEGPPPGEEGSC